MHILVYDQSFEGFLSAVFYVFHQKMEKVSIVKESVYQPSFFEQPIQVETDYQKSDRVLAALQKKTKGQIRPFLYAFHDDNGNIEADLLHYIKAVLKSDSIKHMDFSHPAILKIDQLAKSVQREKHRMEAFVRFRLTKDQIYFASIDPDFDVVPLIKKHFQERYADQQWIIYDLKRNYGIHYDLEKVYSVQFQFAQQGLGVLSSSPDLFTEEELNFQYLWSEYFKSTNIESRKNMKLHLQHVPKRYWKYLSEKQH